MAEQVTILGDGAMATVCSMLLTQGGHRVTMWGAFEESIERLLQNRENDRLLPGARIPADVRLTANDRDCFDGATLILSAIPTQYIRSAWKRLAPYAPAEIPVVSVAKGIENETLLRPSQVIAAATPGHRPMAVLSGPNIAAELARYLPATAVAASEDESFARRVQAVFSTEWFRVYTNTDVTGCELGGTVKNVIAIAVGIAVAMGLGDNTRATLITRGLAEIARLGSALGAQAQTFAGLAGMGDLVATCSSPLSRNRTFGEKLGRGMTVEEVQESTRQTAEGVKSCRSVLDLARAHGVDVPITEAVVRVCHEGESPANMVKEIMSREAKPE